MNSGKLDALHSLTIGARMDMIHNGSALDVWVSVDDKPVCIGAGEPGNFHKIKKGQGDVAFI